MSQVILLASGVVVGFLVYQRSDCRLTWAFLGLLSLDEEVRFSI